MRASGADAERALDDLRALAGENFGDPREPPADAPAPVEEAEPPAAGDAPAGDAPPAPGTTLRGVPASAGVAIGPARRLRPVEPQVDETPAGPPEAEQERLDAARAAVRDELAAERTALQARGARREADIFAAHVALLDDVAITDPAAELVAGGASAPAAWRSAAQDAAAAFRALDDPLLRERAVDVEDVARRVLASLAGSRPAPRRPGRASWWPTS